MTRKDFQLIAQVFRDALDNGQVKTREDCELFCSLSIALANNLQDTNERFDRAKFLEACGGV